MRLPVRFRRRDATAATHNPASWHRSGLFLIGAVGLFMVSLLLGIYLFFPNESLRLLINQEASQQIKGELEIRSLALVPLLTIKTGEIHLASEDVPWPLTIESLRVSPDWTSLFSGSPRLSLVARLMGGTIETKVGKTGKFILHAAGLNFDLPIETPLSLRVAGMLREVSVDGASRLDTDTQTRLTVQLDKAQILGLNISGDKETNIQLGTIELQVDGEGRSMQIKKMTARGGDLEIDGSGTIIVGRSANSSRLNLTLNLRPGPGFDPSLKSLLELSGKPADDGHYELKITGRLTSPSLKM